MAKSTHTRKTHTEKVLLVGEGVHHHALVGKFEMEDTITDYAEINVKEDSMLHHRKPNGTWSNEHKTLPIKQGGYVMAIQTEYNPWTQSVSRVWD